MHGNSIMRRLDQNGRIVLPKEVRQAMALAPGEPLMVRYLGNDVMLSKCIRSPMKPELSQKVLETLCEVYALQVVLCDDLRVVAVGNTSLRYLVGHAISPQLAEILTNKTECPSLGAHAVPVTAQPQAPLVSACMPLPLHDNTPCAIVLCSETVENVAPAHWQSLAFCARLLVKLAQV